MRLYLITILLFAACNWFFAAKNQPMDAVSHGLDNKVSIAIMDVITTDRDENKRRILTEVFRTEIFKMNLFHIVERGELGSILEEHKMNLSGLMDDSKIISIGKFLKTDKLFFCKIGKIFQNYVVNFRVIDVDTSLVDFSENVFIKNEDMLFDALKEIAKKVEIYYMFQKDNLNSTNSQEMMTRKWLTLGASETELKTLMDSKLSPDKYLDIRQYSITYTLANYILTVNNGWDMDVIKNFLQSGIPFENIEKSLKLGIFELNHYRYTFKQAGYTYDDYLTAYENHIVSVTDYRKFQEGFRKDRFIIGAGGIADSMPVMGAKFSFYGGNVAWEHYWTPYQRGVFKWSTETGLFLIRFVYPVPYAQANIYFGSYPFYAKFSVGGHAEAFLGGHFALLFRFGMEIWETVEWGLTIVPIGTQPGVSYSDLKTRIGEKGYVPINFPYYGAFLSIKI